MEGERMRGRGGVEAGGRAGWVLLVLKSHPSSALALLMVRGRKSASKEEEGLKARSE